MLNALVCHAGLHYTTSFPLTMARENAQETVIKTTLKRRYDLSQILPTTTFSLSLRRNRSLLKKQGREREVALRSQAGD